MKILNVHPRMALLLAVVVGVALTALVAGAGSASASTVPRPVITSALTQFDSNPVAKTARASARRALA